MGRIELNTLHKSVFWWFISQGFDFEYSYSMADFKTDAVVV